jgi:cellulose synthase/poly-beta-1,6-N-acetylglucosamine synthase-like glycosyltransferase
VGLVTVERISAVDAHAALEEALRTVERADPRMTASRRFSRGQITGVVVLVTVVAVGLILWPVTTGLAFAAAATLVYTVTLLERVVAFSSSLRTDAFVHVSDEDARAVPDDALPTYTVLIPAFREGPVIADLVAGLERIEYPRDRLEVKLLLEEDDLDTLEAAQRVETDVPVSILVVPRGEPQTKPRALDYGMRFSTGELVTIYDAEDRPEPLQLRRAAVAMARLGSACACLQARLEFYDSHRNLLAKFFSLEYLTWFRCLLPGLVARRGVVPLGGTSNHFRRRALDEVGAWDPWNVTEDADLGIRLQRFGHRIGVLDSVTMEEVNSDLVNWIKQRSRWQKGYLQTALVHLRHPRRTRNEIGWTGLGHLILFVAGTPLLALCNLLFWTLSLTWLVLQPHVIQELFPGWIFYLATATWLLGNFTIAFLGVLTVAVTDRDDLLWSALLAPLYWILMSIASLRATLQLLADPFHWEKTQHGLREQEVGAPGEGPLRPTGVANRPR